MGVVDRLKRIAAICAICATGGREARDEELRREEDED
jgi:hypothetical protein